MARFESASRLIDYVVSYARAEGLDASSRVERSGGTIILSTPSRAGSARLLVELDSVALFLDEYRYLEKVDIDPLGIDDEDVEIYEILVTAARKWLNGQFIEVELRGCFGRSGAGIRIDFEDGYYVELPRGVGRLLWVKHKWVWGDGLR